MLPHRRILSWNLRAWIAPETVHEKARGSGLGFKKGMVRDTGIEPVKPTQSALLLGLKGFGFHRKQ